MCNSDVLFHPKDVDVREAVRAPRLLATVLRSPRLLDNGLDGVIDLHFESPLSDED
jgi:hypothetical protein